MKDTKDIKDKKQLEMNMLKDVNGGLSEDMSEMAAEIAIRMTGTKGRKTPIGYDISDWMYTK